MRDAGGARGRSHNGRDLFEIHSLRDLHAPDRIFRRAGVMLPRRHKSVSCCQRSV